MFELRKDWNVALAEMLEAEGPGHLGTPALLGSRSSCFIVPDDDNYHLATYLPTAVAHTWAEAAWMMHYINKHISVDCLRFVDYGPLGYADYKRGLAFLFDGVEADWHNFTQQLRALPCGNYLTGGLLSELPDHLFRFSEAASRCWGFWEYHPFDIKGTKYPTLKHVLAGYEIYLSEVDSVSEILDWIRQLAGKNPDAYGSSSSSDLVLALDCIFNNFVKLPYKFDPQPYLVAFEKRTEPPTFTRIQIPPKLRHRVLERDGFRCCDCGASPQEDGVKLHVDHRIPVARGGGNDIGNLRTLCFPCNAGKAARIIDYPDGHL